MNFIQRLERNIKNNFPEITTEELKERLSLAKHIIALNHENKLQSINRDSICLKNGDPLIAPSTTEQPSTEPLTIAPLMIAPLMIAP